MRMRRSGYMLGEMMVVVSLCGVVISMATVSLHSVYRMQQGITASQNHRREMQRLALRFREDAHAAKTITQPEELDGGIVLGRTQDETVVYSQSERGLSRAVRRAGKTIHQDQFTLLPRTRVTWRVEQDTTPAVAVLELEPPADHVRGRTAEWTIEAVVGIRQANLAKANRDGNEA
jgi:type II secretory pathway component PulJ